MTVTIELSPEQEREIHAAAARKGAALEAFVRDAAIDAARDDTESPYRGLPRRTPADLLALAHEQGVGPLDLEALQNSGVWPEDETTDDFLATLRSWRREGA